ncbi:MAG TPA: 50S ribosomal protein L25/general stress protein Ctc [Gammaproteobacteria bacterium]|nr:50S ribosomal protein L25/general stress protein Ctc [Gammaproteobacteria bacterium]
MASQYILTAEPRSEQGKGASRRLRRTGKVPAIVYGAGKAPTSICLPHNQVDRHLQDEGFYSQLISLELEGNSEKVVLRDIQRHPAKPVILHMDLLRVNADEIMQMHTPLHFINEEDSVGVKLGGQVSHLLTEVEISCLPGNLLEYIEVDVSGLDVGESLHLSDLTVPEGVQIVELTHGEDHDQAIVTVHKARAGASDDEDGEEEASEA